MPTITNISLSVGDDQPFTDTIYQADGVTPQDITGWLLTFVVHAYGDPNIIYITKTIGSGITVAAPKNGQATIQFNKADTLNMKPDLYSWYVQRTDSGNSKVVSSGLLSLGAL